MLRRTGRQGTKGTSGGKPFMAGLKRWRFGEFQTDRAAGMHHDDPMASTPHLKSISTETEKPALEPILSTNSLSALVLAESLLRNHRVSRSRLRARKGG